MYFVKIRFPGTWLLSEFRDVEPELKRMLHLMAESLVDAALALSMFEEVLVGIMEAGDSVDDFRRDLKSAAAALVRSQMSLDADWGAVSEKSNEQYFDLLMKARVLPSGYESRLPQMHARSFVYALDEIEKALDILADSENLPDSIAGVKQKWSEAFPHLSEVRNSAHHMADRVRGKRRNRDIKPKAVSVAGIETSGGVIMLNMLRGRNYGITLGEGSFQEVPITRDSLVVARDLVQEVIDGFQWEGDPMHHPTS